jgi:hypothetical protein
MKIILQENLPVKDGLCNNIRVGLDPRRILEESARSAILLKVFISNSSSEHILSVVSVSLQGCAEADTADSGREGSAGQDTSGGRGSNHGAVVFIFVLNEKQFCPQNLSSCRNCAPEVL